MANWVDTSHFTPPAADGREHARQRLGLDDDALALVTVGNCGSAKNHAALIEALAECPDLNLVYLHVGEEEQGHPERALAEKLDVEGRCRFLGRINDVRSVLHASDVYVMPSKYEGIGVAALEAAASGLIAVLARVPGLTDLEALLGSAAVWVEPDGQSLASGLRTVATNVVRVERSSLHATVAAEYGIERRAAEFADLYRALARET